jgi:D-alanyl-D-alanine carboxypeptidase
MKKWVHIAIALLTVLLHSGCNAPQPEKEIASYLQALEEEDRFSGVVLVARDGKPILEQAYGLADRDHDVPNRMTTKFNLGSMNKMFTAVAILQWVEQGELAVDDKIIDHLYYYPNQEIANQVTIHQLLTHTSGLGDFFTDEFMDSRKDRFRTLNDHPPLFVDQPLQFEPGTEFSYSNAGFLVLGLIIEHVSKQTYYDYVREHIYGPCGMENSDSYEMDQVVPDRAIGYSQDAMGYTSNVYILPARGSSAGGGYSTAGDLLRFSNCLLDHQLLSPELTESLLEGKVEATGIGAGVEYGYGFIVLTENEQRIVGHSGGSPGVCSILDIFLDRGYTVVVLSNSDRGCAPVGMEIRRILSE